MDVDLSQTTYLASSPSLRALPTTAPDPRTHDLAGGTPGGDLATTEPLPGPLLTAPLSGAVPGAATDPRPHDLIIGTPGGELATPEPLPGPPQTAPPTQLPPPPLPRSPSLLPRHAPGMLPGPPLTPPPSGLPPPPPLGLRRSILLPQHDLAPPQLATDDNAAEPPSVLGPDDMAAAKNELTDRIPSAKFIKPASATPSCHSEARHTLAETKSTRTEATNVDTYSLLLESGMPHAAVQYRMRIDALDPQLFTEPHESPVSKLSVATQTTPMDRLSSRPASLQEKVIPIALDQTLRKDDTYRIPASRDVLEAERVALRQELAEIQRKCRDAEALLGIGYVGAIGSATDDLAAIRRRLDASRRFRDKAIRVLVGLVGRDRLDAALAAAARDDWHLLDGFVAKAKPAKSTSSMPKKRPVHLPSRKVNYPFVHTASPSRLDSYYASMGIRPDKYIFKSTRL